MVALAQRAQLDALVGKRVTRGGPAASTQVKISLLGDREGITRLEFNLVRCIRWLRCLLRRDGDPDRLGPEPLRRLS